MPKQRSLKYFLLGFITSASPFVLGADNSLDYLNLSLQELGKLKISIATGNDTPLEQAPAIASVITAADIKALGLRNLDEVLQIVPGLYVSVSPLTYTPIYTFRGIRSGLNNPQILMLINNTPITSVFSGDRGIQWGGFPVDNIARIEVIRGPGSALYGADAFAGVINIVTKTTQDFRGLEAGIRAGSFNTADTWVIGSGSRGATQTTGYLSVGTTDGQKRTVKSDAQTVNDSFFGTNASLAPGNVNTGYDSLDGHIDIKGSEWQFQSGINIRENLEAGAGAAQALDTDGEGPSKRWTTNLIFSPEIENRNWQPELQLSSMYYHESSNITLFPENTDFSVIGGGSFPDGVIGNPEKWERHFRIAFSNLYTGFNDHTIRLGTGYSLADLYKVKESRNYNFVGTVPVADNNNDLFITPRKRELKYLYLQDEWRINGDWALTTGIRYDDYSDFGNTTNPRLALVWQTTDTITTKLLYGQAFRAPAFTELYSVGNPVVTGSPDLLPEKISTTEAAMSWRAKDTLSLSANIFQYKMTDIIRYETNSDPATGATADNIGEQTGKGIEVEFAWDALDNLRIQGNYAYQQSIDKLSGKDAGLAPENVLHLRGDWRLSQRWASNLQINHVADRQREPSDTRDTIDDYTTVNLSLRAINANKNWEVTLSLLNIFDADVREPSSTTNGTIFIPMDLPMAGRAAFLRFIYQF